MPSDSYICNILGNIELAIDENKLYHKEIEFITGKYCETCLDKNKKNEINAISLVRTLFYTAYMYQRTDDAINYYTQLCRMLGYHTRNVMYNYPTYCNIQNKPKCDPCAGGCCSINNR